MAPAKKTPAKAAPDLEIWRRMVRISDLFRRVVKKGSGGEDLSRITVNQDSTLTLCYRTFGQLATPQLHSLGSVDPQSVDIVWDPVDNATRYAIQLYRDDELEYADTLLTASCLFQSLPQSANMGVRVKAMADSPEDYLESEWSPLMSFDTLNDRILQLSDGEQMVDVFATNGVCMGRCRISEVGRLRLQRGIYVLRYANGQARKMAIGLR